MERPLVVLDTETATALGAPHLLELGALRVVGGEVVDVFEALVRPEVPIEPEVTAVHGITDRDVRDAPPAGEVLARFTDFAGDDWLAAHNAPFDLRVLGFEYGRAGIRPPGGQVIDSLRLARRFVPDSPDHKLATLCEHLALEGAPPHRALADATYCWKLLEECQVRCGGTLEALFAASGAPLSIASHLPRAPRMPQRLRSLRDALAASSRITLLYGEPLSEPARLSVLPRFLFERRGKGYLEAECGRSGELKTYRLDRVHKILQS